VKQAQHFLRRRTNETAAEPRCEGTWSREEARTTGGDASAVPLVDVLKREQRQHGDSYARSTYGHETAALRVNK